MKKKAKSIFNFNKDVVYIPLEDVPDAEWIWVERDITRFEKLWKSDMPIREIAARFGRSEMSVFLLAFDRAMQGEIEPRKGWRIW